MRCDFMLPISVQHPSFRGTVICMKEARSSEVPPDLSPKPWMRSHALGSPVIQAIRREVPEFEATFQAELLAEEGDMESFQAMSTFASWVLARQATDPQAVEVKRAFAVVEDLVASNQGGELIVEFIEVIIGHENAVSCLGPACRSRYLRLA
jgi:hypothetical protein